MTTELERLTADVRDKVVDEALGMDEPHTDWQPRANDLAYERAATCADQSPCAPGYFISVIEEYLDDDDGSLSDYDAVVLVEEHFMEKDGLEAAIRSAAATCVLNSVLDDLEKLGLQG